MAFDLNKELEAREVSGRVMVMRRFMVSALFCIFATARSCSARWSTLSPSNSSSPVSSVTAETIFVGKSQLTFDIITCKP